MTQTTWKIVGGVLVLASVGVSAYHGTKRNNGSVGWGIWWGACGAVFPVITPAIAVAQGLGSPRPMTPTPALAATTTR